MEELERLRAQMSALEADYHALALVHGTLARNAEYMSGDSNRAWRLALQGSAAAQRRVASYRRRITRLQGLLRERKTLIGWLIAKLRRWGGR